MRQNYEKKPSSLGVSSKKSLSSRHDFRACGEIGRRARLRIWCCETCRFESYHAHFEQRLPTSELGNRFCILMDGKSAVLVEFSAVLVEFSKRLADLRSKPCCFSPHRAAVGSLGSELSDKGCYIREMCLFLHRELNNPCTSVHHSLSPWGSISDESAYFFANFSGLRVIKARGSRIYNINA